MTTVLSYRYALKAPRKANGCVSVSSLSVNRQIFWNPNRHLHSWASQTPILQEG